jgi:intracellular sulfur oxidation DsrE/DsrF family protein
LSAKLIKKSFLFFGWLILLATHSVAQNEARYLANIELHTTAELLDVLQRSEMLFDDGELVEQSPVAVVLHGVEARAFLRQDYNQYKSLINLAARLTALGAVDIQVCEVWLGSQSLDASQLQPFVNIVPNGPREVTRLTTEENYIYF